MQLIIAHIDRFICNIMSCELEQLCIFEFEYYIHNCNELITFQHILTSDVSVNNIGHIL